MSSENYFTSNIKGKHPCSSLPLTHDELGCPRRKYELPITSLRLKSLMSLLRSVFIVEIVCGLVRLVALKFSFQFHAESQTEIYYPAVAQFPFELPNFRYCNFSLPVF